MFLLPTIALACLGVTIASPTGPPRAEAGSAHWQEFLSLRGLAPVVPSSSHQLPLAKTSRAAQVQQLDNPAWSVPFLPKGLSRYALTLDVLGSEVLAAGDFIGADNVLISNVARWEGTGWKPLGNEWHAGGIHRGDVSDLERDGAGRIYAAGWFDSAGTKPCRSVARWDGTDWQCMDLAFENEPEVTALTLVGDQVYAGTFHGVFRWNGSGWDSLSPVIRGAVTHLGNSGGKLWVAGRITVDGDSTLRNLLVRNGDKWEGFGSGPGPVRDFAVQGGEIFAIESYRKSDRTDSQVVVRWTGSGWTGVEALPAGAGYSAIEGDSQGLHLLGWEAGKSLLHHCTWDGQRFQTQRSDAFHGAVTDVKLSGGTLYMCGIFPGVGNMRADNVAALQGGRWKGLSMTTNPGLSFPAETMASNGSELFLGGRFLRFAGNLPVSGIAVWDGSKWDAMGGGFKIPPASPNFLDLSVNAISPVGNQVYAGGRFDSSQSGPALNIARWDGAAWQPLGSGFPGPVNAIDPAGQNVFVGGRADSSSLPPGTSTISGQAVARWDGQAWHKLGLGLQGEVKKLIRFGNELYAAGRLRRTGEDSVFGILKWDGDRWLNVEPGRLSRLFDSAFALTVFTDRLYVLGHMRGESASSCLLASLNAQGEVRQEEITHGISLASDDQFLYLLLQSSSQENSALREASVARWNASQGWQSLLSNMGGYYYVYHGEIATLVPSMAVHGSHLYVSGEFTRPMDGVPVHYLARWNRSGTIGIRGPERRVRAAEQRPRIFHSGFSNLVIDGYGRIFDPLGRTLPVLEGKVGAKVDGRPGMRRQENQSVEN